MIYRFGEFTLNEERRLLTRGGQEVPLQPRVFDLLAYLIAFRDRVVSKDELLDALWEDATVVDGALHKAVSAARAALKAGGLANGIRTYARQGYRFCAALAEPQPHLAPSGAPEPRAAALNAFRDSDWQAADSHFGEADSREALDGDALDQWALVKEYLGRAAEAVPILQRAVAAHSMAKSPIAAAESAIKLSHIHLERLEIAIARGWRHRARHYIGERAASRAFGFWRWISCRLAAVDGAPEEALLHAEATFEVGRALEDSELEALGLVYRGFCKISLDRIQEGLEDQDHAAAIVLGGETSPYIAGIVYCNIIWCCRNLADWPRAAQWTENFSLWCSRSGIFTYPGACQLHRSEAALMQGNLEEAETAVSEAIASLEHSSPWCLGEAYRVLGELRLAVGQLDQAEGAFETSQKHGWDPQPGYALLKLEYGDNAAAVRSLQRTLADRGWLGLQRRRLLQAHLACVAAAAGEADLARQCINVSQSGALVWTTPYTRALVKQAEAELLRRDGSAASALDALAAAKQLFHASHARLDAVRIRLLSAEWMLQQSDSTGAALELAEAQALASSIDSPKLQAELRRRLAELHERTPKANPAGRKRSTARVSAQNRLAGGS